MDNPLTTQSLALLGEFLRRWSNLEQTLHLAIAAATKLDQLMNTIMCANLTIRGKLGVLQALVDVSDLEKDTQKRFKKILHDIGDYTPTRNMVAHDFFLVASEGPEPGIAFMSVKAKRSFDTPVKPLGASDFAHEYSTINAFTKELEQLMVRLEHAKFSFEKLELPMKIVGSSARERGQDRSPEADPHTYPPNRIVSNKTPPQSDE